MPGPWFPNVSPRSEWESAFVEALRLGAAEWPDVNPADADSYEWHPLVFAVKVPEIEVHRLVVEVWPEGTQAKQAHLLTADTTIIRGPTLYGFWDNGHFDDDFDIKSPESLVVQGVQATGAEYGRWASDWVVRELSRPLSLLEWKPNGRQLMFEDTGRVLSQHGFSTFRRKLAPTTAHRTVLRGG